MPQLEVWPYGTRVGILNGRSWLKFDSTDPLPGAAPGLPDMVKRNLIHLRAR